MHCNNWAGAHAVEHSRHIDIASRMLRGAIATAGNRVPDVERQYLEISRYEIIVFYGMETHFGMECRSSVAAIRERARID
jgi:hypothetical protein